MTLFLSHTFPSLHLPRSSFPSLVSCSFKPRVYASSRIATNGPIPARDRVIDFGKHKGKMLGTLPSSYLRWVSKNLRARDFEEWGKLADQVLQDPVYRDRMEWEFAENLMTGDKNSALRTEDAVSELLELSERFGWDNNDNEGWSKVSFELLGTSKGGRIPRADRNSGKDRDLDVKKAEKIKALSEEEERRSQRRERLRMRPQVGKEKLRIKEKIEGGRITDNVMRFQRDKADDEDGMVEIYNPFPGREALLKKVMKNKRSL